MIGVGGGATVLADKDSGLTKTRMRSQALDVAPSPVWSLTARDALRAGPASASGLAGWELEPDSSDTKDDKKKKPEPPRATARSPYDVAPVIGPGAKPFVEGVAIGTPLPGRPLELDAWLKPALPAGQRILGAVLQRTEAEQPEHDLLLPHADQGLRLQHRLSARARVPRTRGMR